MFENMIGQLLMLISLALSAVLGFIIGFERKLRFKEAGIRTHTIVCVGAALMMVVSKFAFGDQADSSRVAAQIVSGVGFLGAGMIVYREHGVSGLTTAAGVWTTAGVGMACGGGLYFVAIAATAVIVLLQCLFHIDCRIFRKKKYYLIKIEFFQTGDENAHIKEIFGTDRFNHLVLERKGGRVIYKATLNTATEFSSAQINEIMETNEFILSIERCDSE